ncbi:MAG: exodeoxyribonuclease VII large subunit [Planctomycetota bacterium]
MTDYLFDELNDESSAEAAPRRKRRPKPRCGASESQPATVTELTNAVKQALEPEFSSVWIAGEVTNLSRPRSGHLYFTLKDADSQIRGVMWRSTASRVPFQLEDGAQVLCLGSVEVYGPRGTYQLVVRKCQPQGMGALQLAFEQLRQRLAAEGLFDPTRKRALPLVPKRVAIVTSPSGAAVHDFLNAAAKRHAGVEIIVIPSRVQGEGSANEIVAGVAAAHHLSPRPDVVIVSRGGGSLEDLWSFNEETVVRALARSEIPTVSAVGHEVDVTLSDLAADVRALTPTDAASRVLPDRDSLQHRLDQLRARATHLVQQRVETSRRHLQTLGTRPVFTRPSEWVQQRSRDVDDLDLRGRIAIWNTWRQSRSKLSEHSAALEALSPLGVLARGYTVTCDTEGIVIGGAKEVSADDVIVTRLVDGQIRSRVLDSEEHL